MRLSVSGMMLLHGVAKLRGGVDGIEARLGALGLPDFIAYGVFLGEVVAPLLTDLEVRGYLDDAQFARAWVESRSRSRGAGPGRLRAELRARGVEASLIEAAIRETFADPDTVAASALAVARRRLAILEKRGPERAAARLRAYLLRRGYAAGVVTLVVRTLCGPDAATEA